MPVKRRRGAPGPPEASDSTHSTKMNGRIIRSSFMSIGSEAASAIWLNGTSQSIAMKAAIDHGSSRVVRGQSPA